MRGNGEQRTESQDVAPRRARGRTGAESHRNRTAGLPIRRAEAPTASRTATNGRRECGGHARRGAGDEKRLPLHGGQVEKLRHDRSNGPARLDDGPLQRRTGRPSPIEMADESGLSTASTAVVPCCH